MRGVNDLEWLPGVAGSLCPDSPRPRFRVVSAVGQAEDHAQLLKAVLLTLQEANPSPANSWWPVGTAGVVLHQVSESLVTTTRWGSP